MTRADIELHQMEEHIDDNESKPSKHLPSLEPVENEYAHLERLKPVAW